MICLLPLNLALISFLLVYFGSLDCLVHSSEIKELFQPRGREY